MRFRPIGVAAALALLAACGGAAPPDKAPPRYVEEDPKTVEEAQHQIELAASELEGAPSADRKAETPPAPSREPAPQGGKALSTSEDACAGRCRALASMRRAVAALCRMTGDEDERCTAARRTLESNEKRVATCGCPR